MARPPELANEERRGAQAVCAPRVAAYGGLATRTFAGGDVPHSEVRVAGRGHDRPLSSEEDRVDGALVAVARDRHRDQLRCLLCRRVQVELCEQRRRGEAVALQEHVRAPPWLVGGVVRASAGARA